MPKLTDTQLVILSAAANRHEGAILPPPKSLKATGSALKRSLNTLLRRGLIKERPARQGAAIWRVDEQGTRIGLIVTDAGLQAIDGLPAGPRSSDRSSPLTGPDMPKKRRPASPAANRAKGKRSAPMAPTGSKTDLLIKLLKQKNGASLDQIAAATGWQVHSVRGAISGALKKKRGLNVTSEKIDGRGRIYRIAQES